MNDLPELIRRDDVYSALGCDECKFAYTHQCEECNFNEVLKKVDAIPKIDAIPAETTSCIRCQFYDSMKGFCLYPFGLSRRVEPFEYCSVGVSRKNKDRGGGLMDGKNTICVDVQATVTEQTARRCLKLIEWWLNDNPDKAIRGGYRKDDGLISPLEICESNVKKEVAE